MSDYLKVDDFLAYDSQISKKLGGLRDGLDAVQAQVTGLSNAFRNYVAETGTYCIETNKRLSNIESELAGVKHAVHTLAQMMERGFTLIFARLGIQP